MKKKRIKYGLLLLALLAVNVFILLHRNEGYKYYPYKSLSELYVTDSTLYLKDMRFEGDSVELFFSLPLLKEGYSLEVDEANRWMYYNVRILIPPKENKISVHVEKGVHQYKLTPSNYTSPSIIYKIDHSSYNGAAQNEFLYCNLPGPQIKVAHLKTYHSDKGFSEEEKQNAIKLLQEKTGFHKDSSDFYNTLAITKFAATLCKNPKGIHAYKLSELRPYAQIQEAMKCNADLACGNYSAMIGYLFSVARIPNRLVTFRGPAGNWQYGIHYYSEIYLREQQQWVLIDAANNLAMPFDSTTNKFLNAVDVNNLIKLNGTSGKLAYTFKHDSLKLVPYDSVNSQHIYYNRSNANLCFLHGNADVTVSPFRNFMEFYTFNRDFDYYSEVNRNDWLKIVVKEIAALLFIIVFACYVSAEIKNKVRKKVD